MIKIKKGLDLPILGSPKQEIHRAHSVSTVGLVADDTVGMRPTLLVEVGERVKKGQKLFEDKKIPGVFFTSPVAGTVREINRGERRAFQSIVLSAEGNEQVQFSAFRKSAPQDLSREDVEALLIESGLWTALRTRPYSKTPAPGAQPHAIFVNAMDTQPLGLDLSVAVAGHEGALRLGLEVLSRLTEGTLYWVSSPGAKFGDLSSVPRLKRESFAGPHPAGLVGTHIHYLSPVSAQRTVWHIGVQDVVAIGKLFATGELFTRRVIALGGPGAKEPRLLETVMGADVLELLQGELREGMESRVISGSVLSGRKVEGAVRYLGRFHQQVSVIEEGRHREFLGWQSPGLNKYSFKPAFLSRLFPGKQFAMNSNENGSHRSIVPIGSFEGVMPLDLLPTQLVRMLMVRNAEMAQTLGALELDEEDLALCTFVDPCKNDFGPALRDVLSQIEKEG